MLDGLGFRAEDYDRPVETFSGGQQSRLMLAKLLLAAPDVMLLDEPSNHLDIDATRWLEDYLVKQPEAMLIVSHDRYFLDRVVTKVFEMHAGRFTAYPGNYQAVLAAAAGALRAGAEGVGSRSRSTSRSRRSTSAASTTASCTSRPSRGRRRSTDWSGVERPTLIESPHMHFGEVRRTGDVVLQVEDLAKAYDRPLFQDLSFTCSAAQRLGIMGPNGSGKTTLLRILLGEEEPDTGSVQRGHLVEFGYYDQHLQMLPADKPVIRAVWPDDDPDVTEQPMRDLLRPLRPGRRPGLPAGRRPDRRRTQPGGPGPAGGPGRQRAGPGRADQPPRPVGLRRPGAGLAGVRGHVPSSSATTATSSTAWSIC